MRTDWRLIILLFVAGLLAASQFAKISLTLEPLRVIYPGMPLPFAVSALSVTGFLFGVTAGVLVARFGVRRTLLSALLAGAVLSIAQSLLPPFPAFMALRLLEGAAHLSIVVSAPTLMATVAAPRHVPIAMGIWGTFFGVGFAVSAAAIPLLGGPAAVYLAHGLGLLVLALCLWPLLPTGTGSPGNPEGFVARHLAIYRTPRLIAPAVGFVWHTIMFLALLTFLPRYLGMWTAPILPLAALVGTFGAGLLSRRVAPSNIALAGFVATMIGMALLLMLPDSFRSGAAIALLVVIGLVPGASFANVPHLNAAAADRARANGAIAQLGNFGTALSIPVYSAVLAGGLAGLAWFTIALSAAGCIAVGFIHRKIAKSG